MEEWLRERSSIEWAFSEALRSQPLTPQRAFRVENMAQYELVAFAAGAVRSYERLSEGGRRRLRGVLLDGLKEDKGLSSVQHEITTAVHLMSRGFDVEFHDIEHGGGFDFVARNGDIERTGAQSWLAERRRSDADRVLRRPSLGLFHRKSPFNKTLRSFLAKRYSTLFGSERVVPALR